MVKVSVDNGYLRILGKSCLRIPDTWAKLSADTGYRQKAVSAPVSMDTWGSMCHPAGNCERTRVPNLAFRTRFGHSLSTLSRSLTTVLLESYAFLRNPPPPPGSA